MCFCNFPNFLNFDIRIAATVSLVSRRNEYFKVDY